MEVRQGSAKLCMRLIKAAEQIAPVESLREYRSCIADGVCTGQHPVAVGLFAAAHEVDGKEALSIYVIDVAQGEKIPRKGGPGVTRSDLLVINKIDLAPLVGASLEVMASDSARMREGRKFLFTNLVSGEGLDDVISWIKSDVLFEGK